MEEPVSRGDGASPRPLLFYFPATPRLTGAHRTVFNLVRSVDRSRFRPVFVAHVRGPLTGWLESAGIETAVVPFPPILQPPRAAVVGRGLAGQLRTARAVAAYGRQMEALARRLGSCGFWARGMDAALLLSGAARRLRQPLVVEIASEPPPSGALRAGYWYAAWRAARLVQQDTRQLAMAMGPRAVRAFGGKVRVIPPGITAERVEAALALPRPDGSAPFTILCAATLHPRKNQMMLLRAAVPLARRHPGLRIRLAGIVADAEHEARLRAFARDRLPAGTVEFLGWRDDVPVLMRQSDVVVLCSRNEAIPHTLREAMHLEVPIVATAVGGMPELLTDGETGFLVPDDDADALARALERCIADPAGLRRVALRARDHVRANFSFAAWTERYNQLLREVFDPASLTHSRGGAETG